MKSRTSIFYFFICALYSMLCFGQVYRTDSIRIYALLDKADQLDLSGKLDSALSCTRQAQLSARDINFRRGLGFAILKEADLLLKTDGTISKVLAQCYQGIELGRELRDSFLIALGLHQSGQYFRDKAMYDSAVYKFQSASNYYDELKHPVEKALIYNDIAFIKERLGEYPYAVDYYFKAIILFERLDNIKEWANTLGNLGIVNYRMGKKPEAIRLFKESALKRERINDHKGLAAIYGNLATVYGSIDLDSSVYYQMQSLDHAVKTGTKPNIAQAYANASMLLSKQKKYVEAIQYEHQAIQLYTDIGDQYKLANRDIALALLYHLQNDSLNALAYFQKAEKIGLELNNKPILQNLQLQRSNFYKERGDYKEAFKHVEGFHSFKDSLLNEKSLLNIAELQSKYELERKDFEISKLTSEQKLNESQMLIQKSILLTKKLEGEGQESKIRILEQEQLISKDKQQIQKEAYDQQIRETQYRENLLSKEKAYAQSQVKQERKMRNLILMSSVLILMLGYLLFNRFTLKQEVKAKEHLLSLRNVISKDLHDEIGSTLTSISVLSQAGQQHRHPEQIKEMLTKISTQSKRVQQNLSDIVWAMRPDTDSTASLLARVREYAAGILEADSIKFSIHADDEIMLHSLSEFARREILLILKEAINNIYKHAHATVVSITISQLSDKIIFKIMDNGIWKKKPEYSGSGLLSMKERALKIEGDFLLDYDDQGTKITLTIPKKLFNSKQVL